MFDCVGLGWILDLFWVYCLVFSVLGLRCFGLGICAFWLLALTVGCCLVVILLLLADCSFNSVVV